MASHRVKKGVYNGYKGIKFNKSKIRLWVGIGNTGNTNLIGIKFNEGNNAKDIDEIYKIVQSLLELKYGKGIEGKKK